MCLAIPGRVTAVSGDVPLTRTGRVEFGGVAREISLSLVPDAQEGDWVLVHAGMALNLIDEEEARLTLEELKQLGELGGGLLSGDEYDRREQETPPEGGAP